MSDLLPWMAPWSGRILTTALPVVGVLLTNWAHFQAEPVRYAAEL